MTKTDAIAKLTKLLGKKFAYRINPKAPKPEDRETARVSIRGLAEQRDAAKAARQARMDKVLGEDAEYQRLKAEDQAVRKALEEAQMLSGHYKITVGVANSVFFQVQAEGDTWAEVVKKVEKK